MKKRERAWKKLQREKERECVCVSLKSYKKWEGKKHKRESYKWEKKRKKR